MGKRPALVEMFGSRVFDDLNRSSRRASGAFCGHSDGCFPALGVCGREFFQEGFDSCWGDVAAASDEDGEVVHSVEAGVATFAGKCLVGVDLWGSLQTFSTVWCCP